MLRMACSMHLSERALLRWDVEEDVVLFQNHFLTCTVILTGDEKGMQAMGGAGSECWL